LIYKVLRELEEWTSDWRSEETVESYATSMSPSSGSAVNFQLSTVMEVDSKRNLKMPLIHAVFNHGNWIKFTSK